MTEAERIAALKPMYFCTRCKSIVRETDDYGEFIAGECRCDSSPSPWVSVDLHWEGLAEKFLPGGTALPKSITGARNLLPHAKSVSVGVAESLIIWLEAAYERNAALTAERDALRETLVTAMIPIEAILLSGADAAHCQGVCDALRDARATTRAALKTTEAGE